LTTADYSFLPHTTDAYVEATGASLEGALESAGKALFDTLCEVETIRTKLTDRIAVEGHDEVELAYNWLEALLLKFELTQRVYSRFKIIKISRTTTGFNAIAEAFGEPYDRKRHGAKVEVKAVTYHRMEIVRHQNRTFLRFILDL